MRSHIVWWPIIAALSVTKAAACAGPPPVPVEELARTLAADAVLIDGTVVQAFDARKQKPEIIRADTIYIGEPNVRNFVIYRSQYDFDLDWTQPSLRISCHPPWPMKKGEQLRWLVLLPANRGDPTSNGRWKISANVPHMTVGKLLDRLVSEAETTGRLQLRPLSE